MHPFLTHVNENDDAKTNRFTLGIINKKIRELKNLHTGLGKATVYVSYDGYSKNPYTKFDIVTSSNELHLLLQRTIEEDRND